MSDLGGASDDSEPSSIPSGTPVSLALPEDGSAFDEAKRKERMADELIVERLRRTGFVDGPEWRLLACALVEYGYVVLVVWGCNGSLGRHAARYGGVSGRRVPADLWLDESDAQALAAEVLLVATDKFRTSSLPRWKPTGGASLKTFFIGRCMMELADVYLAWHNREQRPLPLGHSCVDDGRHQNRSEDVVEARIMIDQLLDHDPGLREMLLLQADGYTLAEIAKRLGASESSVRSRIHRGRRQLYRKEDL
jgi:DNA-directed RNA polymerase specialized sigma24 family protein